MKYFGTTIKETIAALTKGPHFGATSKNDKSDYHKAKVRIIVTLILCAMGIYLIVFANKITEGISLLTLVAGYWLK